jgi:hypothetical protein
MQYVPPKHWALVEIQDVTAQKASFFITLSASVRCTDTGTPVSLYQNTGNVGLDIVTCIPIARQRVGKHIPATHAHATYEQ